MALLPGFGSFARDAIARGMKNIGGPAEDTVSGSPAQEGVQAPTPSIEARRASGGPQVGAPGAGTATTKPPTTKATPPPTDFLGRPVGTGAAPGIEVPLPAGGQEPIPSPPKGENGHKPKVPTDETPPAGDRPAEVTEKPEPLGLKAEKAFRSQLLKRHEQSLKKAENKSFWDTTKEWLGSDWKNLLIPAGLLMMFFNNNVARLLGAVAIGAGGYNLYQRGKALLSDDHPHHDLVTNAIAQSASYTDPQTKENIPFGNSQQVVENIRQTHGPEAAQTVKQGLIDYQMAHRIGGTDFIMRQLANRQEQALREKYGRDVNLGYQSTVQENLGSALGSANQWIQSQWQGLWNR